MKFHKLAGSDPEKGTNLRDRLPDHCFCPRDDVRREIRNLDRKEVVAVLEIT
jgi:hypothetical protein